MTLKLTVDTLDGVDEPLRALYEEADGKYRLKVDGIEDVAPLKAKISELLGETKSEREKRKALEASQTEAERKAAEEKGEFQKLYQAEQEARRKIEADLSGYREKITKGTLDGEAGKMAAELSRDTAKAALLTEQAAKFIKVADDGLQYEIGGVKVDRAKVLDHLKAAYPFLADGNQSNGGGANGGGGGAGSITKEQFKAMGDKERIALHKNDPETFRRLAG